MNGTWSLTSWQDIAILTGIVAALAGVGGAALKARLDKRQADAAASDRIIRLVEVEAEKRVEVVRTEFALKIAEMELAHRDQIASMRQAFETQLAALKKERATHRCELAPVCGWRNGKIAPPPPMVA